MLKLFSGDTYSKLLYIPVVLYENTQYTKYNTLIFINILFITYKH